MKTGFAHYDHQVKIYCGDNLPNDNGYNDLYSWLSNELDFNDHAWSQEYVPLLGEKSYMVFSFERSEDAMMFGLLFGDKR